MWPTPGVWETYPCSLNRTIPLPQRLPTASSSLERSGAWSSTLSMPELLLAWFCAGTHSCRGFIIAIATSWPEDSISQFTSPPSSSSYMLAIRDVGLIQMCSVGLTVESLPLSTVTSFSSLHWVLSIEREASRSQVGEQPRSVGHGNIWHQELEGQNVWILGTLYM